MKKYNIGYIVDKNGKMPEHIKGNSYIVRDLITGDKKSYGLPNVLPGLKVWYITLVNGVKEVYAPKGKDKKDLRIFNRLGRPTELIETGAPMEEIVSKLEPKYENKTQFGFQPG